MKYQQLSFLKSNELRYGLEEGGVFQHMIEKFYPTDTINKSRNRDLFVMRYCGTEIVTYKKLGEIFNVSGSRARQISNGVRYRINRNIIKGK